MEREKQSAKPQEVECPRPDLYVVQFDRSINTDGIWLWTGTKKVIVRDIPQSQWPENVDPDACIAGFWKPNPPTGPKYTGPIDDETMANILIYG